MFTQAALGTVLHLCLDLSSHRVWSVLGPSVTVYLKGFSLKFFLPVSWIRPGWVDICNRIIFFGLALDLFNMGKGWAHLE